MPKGIIELVDSISKTMDELIDFMALDEFLGAEFEGYLERNKIEINSDSKLNDVLIEFILDGRLKDNKRVLDYCYEKSKNSDKEIIDSLKTTYVSVFQIKKISKTGYEVEDIIQNQAQTLIPLVKTTSLRGIGLYDYIKSRIVKIKNNFYILEIFSTFGQYREYFAYVEATKTILKNPKLIVMENKDKFLKLKKLSSDFHSTFMKTFNKDEIIISSSTADKFLNDFYLLHTGKIDKIEIDDVSDFNLEFFEPEEFNNDLVSNALIGFSKSKVPYDIGIFSDKNLGFFVIPFLQTFNEILKRGKIEKESEKKCVDYILSSNKVPHTLLIKKNEEFKNLISIVNETKNTDFTDINQIIDAYKSDFKDGMLFSIPLVLFESEIFSKICAA